MAVREDYSCLSKDAVVRSVMCDVMRFSEELYQRYKVTENQIVKEAVSRLQSAGFMLRSCAVVHLLPSEK